MSNINLLALVSVFSRFSDLAKYLVLRSLRHRENSMFFISYWNWTLIFTYVLTTAYERQRPLITPSPHSVVPKRGFLAGRSPNMNGRCKGEGSPWLLHLFDSDVCMSKLKFSFTTYRSCILTISTVDRQTEMITSIDFFFFEDHDQRDWHLIPRPNEATTSTSSIILLATLQ